jgi:hypothetical protein
MHRFLQSALLLFFILAGMNSMAQKYVMIKGQVWDLTGENLVGAHAYNSTRHYGTFTDIDGIFFLVMVPGDSMRVSMIGYKPYKMKIPDKLSADSYKLDITLVGDTIILRTAEIRPYPATYAELRQEFMKLRAPEEKILDRITMPDINYGSKYTNPDGGGIVLPGPLSLLYNTFSKEAKELKKMNKILAEDRLREDIISIISRRTLETEFGIKTDEQIDVMIKRCNLTPEFIRGRSHYDIIKYIMQCYK